MRTATIIFAAMISLAADPPPPSGQHTQCRAGNADQVTWHAVPGLSMKASGGWVGGGRLCQGVGRTSCEGTWGWDYIGKGWYPGRVFLHWSPSCARQPKAGRYKVDGPEVPDIFAVKPIKRAIEKRHAKEEHDE